MPNIKKLPTTLINQIAAGEIADRPASIIKELIENAIDAESTEIIIDLVNAGIDSITIIDNGLGMDEDDIIICFHPHTTSKLTQDNSLVGIKTLGFRGEALSSIASVSHLHIKSKKQDDISGNHIEIINGDQNFFMPTGMPDGTQITVSHLFDNVPARKNFLKTPKSEIQHISKLISNYALAYPDISFSLINNDKKIVDFHHHHTLIDRIKTIIGDNFTEKSLPIQNQDDHIRISGFISPPSLARESHLHQYIFINSRPVKSSLFSKHIKKSYGGLLEPTTQPLFVINLTIPEHLIDVNIHPQKKEVSFTDQHSIIDLLDQTIINTLEQYDVTYNKGYSLSDQGNSAYSPFQRDKKTHTPTHQKLKTIVQAWETTQNRSTMEVLQIHDLYLIAQTNDGMIVIDQHAAHERILYEQFLAAFHNQNKNDQKKELNKPIILKLSLNDSQILQHNLETLDKLGLTIEEFGDNIYKITAIPPLMEENQVEPIITQVIDDLANDFDPRDIDRASDKTIAYLSCRSAIKSGDTLSQEERKNLLTKLAQTKTNYTCPHGRPTQMIISIKELEKMFKRRK